MLYVYSVSTRGSGPLWIYQPHHILKSGYGVVVDGVTGFIKINVYKIIHIPVLGETQLSASWAHT